MKPRLFVNHLSRTMISGMVSGIISGVVPAWLLHNKPPGSMPGSTGLGWLSTATVRLNRARVLTSDTQA